MDEQRPVPGSQPNRYRGAVYRRRRNGYPPGMWLALGFPLLLMLLLLAMERFEARMRRLERRIRRGRTP
ncbi:hypothetical protein ORV05_16495 [Amycolatopsis cynarae]|uniref:Uncharacterized protein n=1 Tax=Amycolatopsis cynarae TaxID=2995223 RepID=A0ABY7BDS8_9PSEU|nr:hypothetical protein [Amycolatopsis sp. HUAS 11-8]WAL69298.1 hypothetical protein ORV05_16495 [Amycolatopsis sp. HUAS 11-8]